jgi:hypothetical protein
MRKTQEIIKTHVDRAKTKQKEQYDKKVKAVKISVGDREFWSGHLYLRINIK